MWQTNYVCEICHERAYNMKKEDDVGNMVVTELHEMKKSFLLWLALGTCGVELWEKFARKFYLKF